jgi:hypothetical protein
MCPMCLCVKKSRQKMTPQYKSINQLKKAKNAPI